MRLELSIIEDQRSGEGVIQITEDRSPMQQLLIGFIAFGDREKRDLYVDALIKGGKFGEIVP